MATMHPTSAMGHAVGGGAVVSVGGPQGMGGGAGGGHVVVSGSPHVNVGATTYASASLYVGDLSPDVTEALLFEIFSAVGAVASVRVCRDAATRRSLGYAYVNFHRVEDAERALDTMNFTMIKSRQCRIMWSHRDPSLRKSGQGNIFVKNLAKNIDNKTLYDTFSVFGNILSCKVATNSKRESLGYGFVHYESDQAAADAIASVNGMVIASEKVAVFPFKSKKDRGGNDRVKFTNVYVKNLPEDFRKEQLNELFGKYGNITSSTVAMDEKENKSRCFGFVNFRTADQAAVAVENLNNYDVSSASGGSSADAGGAGGQASKTKLVVCRAQKKEEREKELRERFEQSKLDRQKKWAGVNLYIKNLSDNFDDMRLRQEFSRFGQITSSRIMRDKNGKSRCFGFVCFSSPEEATKAVTEMNLQMIDGKPLYVALAQRKDVRRAQLEATYAQRAKMAMAVPPQPFYSPQAPHLYYPGVPPQTHLQALQSGFYNPHLVRRQWNPVHVPPHAAAVHAAAVHVQQQQPMMNVRQPPQYAHPALMTINGQPQQQRPTNPPVQGRGRGRGRGGKNGGAVQPNAPMPMGVGAVNGRRGAGAAPAGVGAGAAGAPATQFKYTANARNQGLAPNAQVASVPSSEAVQQADASSDDSSLVIDSSAPLTSKALASAPEEQRKQMLGERLFPLIAALHPDLAAKITGMLLEMDNSEILNLIESELARQEKIEEALQVLKNSSADDEEADDK